jgi:hypothetical protein
MQGEHEMAFCMIAFDLHEAFAGEKRDYKPITEGIREVFPDAMHMEESLWIVQTDFDEEQCFERVRNLFRAADTVHVGRFVGRPKKFGATAKPSPA